MRSSWDFENQAPRALVLPHSKRLDSRIRSFDTSQNSDGQSSNSDENFDQLQDFDEDSLPTNSSSPWLSVRIPNYVEIDMRQEETKDNSDDNLDDICKEVRCIEVEEPSTNRQVETNMSDSRPNRFLNSYVPSPEEKPAFPGFTSAENGVSPDDDLGSPPFKKTEDPNSFPPVFQILSPEKRFQWLLEKDFSGSACFKLTRSRSCRARLTTSLYAHWFDREERDESTPPLILERSFAGRPEGFQKKVLALNYGADTQTLTRNDSREMLSRSGSQEKLSDSGLQEKLSRSDSQEKLSKNSSPEMLSKSGSQEKLSRSDSQEMLSRNSSQEMLSKSSSQEKLQRSDSQEKLSRHSSHELLSRSGSQDNLSRNGSQETSSKINSHEKLSRNGSEDMLFRSGSQEKLSRNSSREMSFRSDSQETLSRNSSQVSARSDVVDELKTIDIPSPDEDENVHIANSTDKLEEPVDSLCENPPAESKVCTTSKSQKLNLWYYI